MAVDYDRDRYEVIVIDDGADDITIKLLDEFKAKGVALTLDAQTRGGAARARNRGARMASGEMVLFCDDDIVVEPSHLRQHIATSERHPRALVNGGWQFAPAVLETLMTSPFGRFRVELERHFQQEVAGEPLDGDASCLRMHMLGSWDLAMRRDLFWEIGGFDEEFPVAGAEDQDFSMRSRAAGALLLLDTHIRCLHNDNRLTLRAYCAREERSAQTMPYLARKYPAEFGHVPYVLENGPILRGDPPSLKVKKLAKQVLALTPVLGALHRLTDLLETAHAPERLLRRLYTALLGLHLFRGFRRAWSR
jgi:glycosyltransferase involved in cell wall biosynthesis